MNIKNKTNEDMVEQLADDIQNEYKPDSHETWQSVLRVVSRMSTKSDVRVYDRMLMNMTYTTLKMRYRQWMHKR